MKPVKPAILKGRDLPIEFIVNSMRQNKEDVVTAYDVVDGERLESPEFAEAAMEIMNGLTFPYSLNPTAIQVEHLAKVFNCEIVQQFDPGEADPPDAEDHDGRVYWRLDYQNFGRSVPIVAGYDEWDSVRRKVYEYEDLGTDVELDLSAYRDRIKLGILVKDSAVAEYVGDGDERHPVLDSRSVNTVVDVRRGDTVMLGGIERSVERENVSEIPYFSSIPVIGRIGRRREDEVLNVEVVVMVTVKWRRYEQGNTQPPAMSF